jgi:hypothetical protein
MKQTPKRHILAKTLFGLALLAALSTTSARAQDDGGDDDPRENTGLICVHAFYDVNLNGSNTNDVDATEVRVAGWKFELSGPADCDCPIRRVEFADTNGYACFLDLPPGCYTIRQIPPNDRWIATSPRTEEVCIDETNNQPLACFGVVLLGPCDSEPKEFWTSRRGKNLFLSDDCGCEAIELLSEYNLVDRFGDDFDPESYSDFRCWVLGVDDSKKSKRKSRRSNLAYELSVELSVAVLNTQFAEFYELDRAIFALGTMSGFEADLSGFAAIAEVIVEADNALLDCPVVSPGSPKAPYFETLISTLADANNDLNFLQAEPGKVSYKRKPVCRCPCRPFCRHWEDDWDDWDDGFGDDDEGADAAAAPIAGASAVETPMVQTSGPPATSATPATPASVTPPAPPEPPAPADTPAGPRLISPVIVSPR